MNSTRMSQSKRIRDYLAENRQPMVDLLCKLVLAESPSMNIEAQELPLMIMAEALGALDFDSQIVPGHETGGHLLATSREVQGENGSLPKQLLLGHCDTVWPLGTLDKMPLVVEDNVVRGPGVYDMKSGLTQMIFALRALKEIGAKPVFAPVVLINTDEEIGSVESMPTILQLAQQVERALVLEPALGLSGRLKTARKGVGRFEIVVHGRAAHAGLDPDKGVSAVLGLSYVVQALYALNDGKKGISVNVGVIEGGLRANVIAPEARAVVDVRVPARDDARHLEEAIQRLSSPMAGVRLDISGGFNRPPLERTPANQALWRTAEGVARDLGITIEQGMAGGGSDGNYTSLHTATLDGLGAVGDGAHASHEFIFIDKMIERTALLASLLITA